MTSLAQRLFAIQGALQSNATLPKIIEFGEWLPDRAALGLPGVVIARNVRPCPDGYRPLPGLTAQSDALSARPQGAAAVRDTTGTVYYYAGDASKLYRLFGAAWSDVSKSGGYMTAADSTWEFALFGSTFIATNFDDPVQSQTIGSGSFADHITSSDKPKARHMDVVREFLVLGNTNDAVDGTRPSRVWWSGINDSDDFTPAASTQCDFQDLPDGGWVQRIVGGVEYGLIFQETMIRRMTYVGSPLVFELVPIDRARGTPIPNSVIGYGRLVFFISDDGFFMTDGISAAVPIGDEKVDRTFWSQFDVAYASRVSTAIDPVSKVVMWAFPGSGHSSGTPNVIYLYHWPTRRWAESNQSIQWILRALSKGYTLDELDTVSTSIDSLGFSLDSRAWTGNVIKLAGFNTSHVLVFFDGTNLAATIDTGDFQPNPDGLSLVSSLRPLIDGGTVTAQLASRIRVQDSVSYGTAATIDTDGKCSVLDTGRYHRARLNVPAGSTWNHAQGFQITYSNAGMQ